MNRLIVFVCFCWPLFNACLNIQNLVSRFVGESETRLIAYSNLALILIGVALIRKQINVTSKIGRLWFFYYMLYFCFGILAIGLTGFDPSRIIIALIPVIYFMGFYFLLSNKEYFKIFMWVMTISLVLSSLFTIILFELNFSFSKGVTYLRALDRAEGLYGDANNAALVSILAFLFFDKFYKPLRLPLRLLKIAILIAIAYSLFLTFSTTGLFAFIVILFVKNHKLFSGVRLVVLGLAIVLFYSTVFLVKNNISNFDLTAAQTAKVENVLNLLTFNLDKVDDSGRRVLAENVLQYAYENPIIGNGIDFSVTMRGHNTYVGVWADAGIFTFLFFLFVLFFYLLKSFQIKPEIRFFAISVLIVLYIFMFSLQTVINQPYLIVLFAFVGYIIHYNERHEKDD